MSNSEIYTEFIEWQKQKGLEIPESEYLMPLIKSYYTVEECVSVQHEVLGWPDGKCLGKHDVPGAIGRFIS